MSSFQIDVLKPSEVGELLALQKANLKSNISLEAADIEGFLTFQYSEETIIEMLNDMPQPVARSEEGIVGYALATSFKVASNIDLVAPLIEICQCVDFKLKPLLEQNYYFLGQVCVKQGWRGLGVFNALYQKHKELFAKEYDCIVTEVAEENTRSMSAHKRIGFENIHHYHDHGNHWHVVAWDFC